MTTERLLQETRWLERMALGLCADPDRAADVVQETMARALARPPRIGPDGPRPWLATVARNVARRLARREAQRPDAERRAACPEATGSTVDLVARAEVHRAAVDAVLALEEPYRTALLLRYLEDQPIAGVAARLGVPLETARTWIRRGLERVRRRLDRRPGGRRAWLLALGVRPPVTTTAVLGVVMMGLKGKTLAAAALAVVAGVIAFATGAWPSDPAVVPGAGPPDVATPRVAAGAPPADPDRVAVGADALRSAVEVEPPAVAGRRLRGTVVAEESRVPLPGAVVRLRARGAATSAEARVVATTSTAADGSFDLAFEPVAGEQLEVELEAAGRALVREPVRRRGETAEAAARRVELGQLTMPPGALIAGRVLDADGIGGLPDAELLVAREWTWYADGTSSVILRDAGSAGTSTAGGRFELAHRVVPSGWRGPLLLAVHERGLGWVQIEDLRRGALRRDDVEIELEPAFELELVVSDELGRPAAEAPVRVEPAAPPLGGPGHWPHALGPLGDHFTRRTNAAGVLRLRDLPATCAAYRVYIGSTTERCIRIDVTAGAAGSAVQRRVVLPASPTIDLLGSVVDETGHPIADARIESGAGDGTAITSDPDGRFRLALPRVAHPVRVTVSADGRTGIHRFVDVASGAIEEWKAVLVRSAVLSGTVVDAAGQPVVGAEVEAAPEDRSGRLTDHTDRRGAFSIEARMGVPHRMTAHSDTATLRHLPVVATPGDGPVTIVVESVPILLVPLRARVVDASGDPVEVVSARVERIVPNGEGDREITDLRIGGVEAVLSRVGRWRLTVHSDVGCEGVAEFEIDRSTTAVAPTVVVTRGIEVECELFCDPPLASAVDVTVSCTSGGQHVSFVVGKAAPEPHAQLRLPEQRRVRLIGVDPRRPVVLVVRGEALYGRSTIEPGAATGVVRLRVTPSAWLVVEAARPWREDEMHLELWPAGRPEQGDFLRIADVAGRTDLLRWEVPAGAHEWRVKWPEGVQPASGRLEIAPGGEGRIVLTPR